MRPKNLPRERTASYEDLWRKLKREPPGTIIEPKKRTQDPPGEGVQRRRRKS